MKKIFLTLICALMCTVAALAQGNLVRGTVFDENGEPVIGASVMIKGTKTGTVTNAEGQFTLNDAVGKTLVITYIGYENQEVKAQRTMEIHLQSSSTTIDEVVVTGMQKMDS